MRRILSISTTVQAAIHYKRGSLWSAFLWPLWHPYEIGEPGFVSPYVKIKHMVAILHNIRSLHNVGSIFRSADGVGIDKIYLTGYTPSPLDKFGKSVTQFTKVSLGAEDFVAWEKAKDINPVIKKLKADGYSIIALEQSPRSIPYDSFRPRKTTPRRGHGANQKLALLVGNEVRGLSAALLKKCDVIIEIPMRGRKESLNVSVAFGIASYELTRQTPFGGR